jgi:hypothetical protein
MGNKTAWVGTAGVNAGDVIYTSLEDSFNAHYIEVTAATVSFEATVDGTNWFAIAAHELDQVAAATNVLTTTKDVVIKGRFMGVRVLQSGATAANARGFSVTE